MPTVDRKNTDTDEKHSLSSFDKRKVQSVTFGAKQQSRKKYKVVKHEYGSAAPDKDIRAPVEHEENVDKPTVKNNSYEKRAAGSSTYSHNKNSEHKSDTSSSVISPEMAQRMQLSLIHI